MIALNCQNCESHKAYSRIECEVFKNGLKLTCLECGDSRWFKHNCPEAKPNDTGKQELLSVDSQSEQDKTGVGTSKVNPQRSNPASEKGCSHICDGGDDSGNVGCLQCEKDMLYHLNKVPKEKGCSYGDVCKFERGIEKKGCGCSFLDRDEFAWECGLVTQYGVKLCPSCKSKEKSNDN